MGLGGRTVPRSLAIGADNTTREAKNQYFQDFVAYEKATNKFEAIDTEFMRVCHTHNEQDQRFSVVAGKISRAPVLEEPEDFQKWMLAEIQPARGRRLHVEILHGTWNFQKWFLESLNINVSGLASTHAEPEANHVWRYVSRSLLKESGLTNESVQCTVDAWKELPPHPQDAILMVKQYMHDQKFSQMPILALPAAVAEQLDPAKLEISPPVPLGDTVLKEFRKTAKQVGAAPWNLLKAEHYLTKLCDDNAKNTLAAEPAGLQFALQYKLNDVQLGGAAEQFKHLDSSLIPLVVDQSVRAVPRAVHIGNLAQAEKKRRLKNWSQGKICQSEGCLWKSVD